jgi:hypothetical protein
MGNGAHKVTREVADSLRPISDREIESNSIFRDS